MNENNKKIWFISGEALKILREPDHNPCSFALTCSIIVFHSPSWHSNPLSCFRSSRETLISLAMDMPYSRCAKQITLLATNIELISVDWSIETLCETWCS
jgi:hypothetical protein